MATSQKRATRAKATTTRGTEAHAGTTKRTSNGSSGTHMVENLEEGLLIELADMLYAKRELVKVLPKLAQASGSRRLRDTLEWYTEQSEDHLTRLEEVFRLFGHRPTAETCEGIQGILTECKELLQKTSPGPVRDAMIIAATQKAGHYGIAAYGTLCSWAHQLGEDRAVRLLDETLHEERAIDRNLTRIAEFISNPQADRGDRRPDRGPRDPRSHSDEGRFGGMEDEWRGREPMESARMRDDRNPRDYDDPMRGRSGRGKRYGE